MTMAKPMCYGFQAPGPENRSCGPAAALHEARNGVSHSVASCALQLGHSCGFQGTERVSRKDSYNFVSRIKRHPIQEIFRSLIEPKKNPQIAPSNEMAKPFRASKASHTVEEKTAGVAQVQGA